MESDENGGSDFKLLSEAELLSVPNALHAKSADNVNNADTDATNEIQKLSLDKNILSISNGNSIMLSLDTKVPVTDAPIPIAFRGSQIFAHPVDNAQSIIFGEFTDA